MFYGVFLIIKVFTVPQVKLKITLTLKLSLKFFMSHVSLLVRCA